MPTGSSRKRTKRLAADAAFLCAALALSYLEAVVPLSYLIPLPGAKPGLANLAILLTAYRCSLADAAAVSFLRVIVSALLFGSVQSLAFSLCGAALSFAVLTAIFLLPRLRISFIGCSVLCAAAHNLGQLLCAVWMMHETALFSYAPALLFFAVCFGALTGWLMNCIARRLPRGNTV